MTHETGARFQLTQKVTCAHSTKGLSKPTQSLNEG